MHILMALTSHDQSITFFTARNRLEVTAPGLREPATFRTTHAGNISVQFQHIFIPRHTMQTIHVLGDERKFSVSIFHLSQRVMTGVGRHSFDRFAAESVPIPDEFGVARECFRGGQVFGTVLCP